MGCVESEGVPPVSPRTAGAVIGVKNEEVVPGREAAVDEFMSARETSLSCTNNDCPVVVFHASSV